MTVDGPVRVRFPAKGAKGKARWIRLSWNEGGKRRQTTAGSMDRWADAWREANDIGARIAVGRGEPASVRLRIAVDAWLAEGRDVWSLRYYANTRDLANDLILPALGEVFISDLTYRQVSDLIHAQRSASGKRHVRAALSSCLSFAKRRGYSDREPEDLLARNKRPRGVAYLDPKLYPNEAQVTSLVHAMGRTREYKKADDFTPPAYWQLMVLTAAYCGLRRGELWELRAGDLSGKSLRVERQVVRVDGAYVVTPPKNNSVRDVFVIGAVPGGWDLRKLLAARARAVGPGGLLFPAPRGGYWNASNFSVRVWNPAREIAWGAGSKMTLHGLRHFYARWWLDRGLPAMDVSRFAGHSSVAVTLGIYVSPTEGAMKRAESLG